MLMYSPTNRPARSLPAYPSAERNRLPGVGGGACAALRVPAGWQAGGRLDRCGRHGLNNEACTVLAAACAARGAVGVGWCGLGGGGGAGGGGGRTGARAVRC